MTAAIDRHGISAITPYDGGFFIADTRYFEGSIGLVRVDADGHVIGDWTSSEGPATAEDGRVAWTSFVAPESGETGPQLVHVGDPVVTTSGLEVALVDSAGVSQRVPRMTNAFDATDHWIAGALRRGRGIVDAATGEAV
ncbi:MAG: hypothetical protein WKF50_08995 [Nocardioides sp.]